MLKRCSERELRYTPTTIILPDSTAAEGVITDESCGGCGVRIKGQYEIEEGMKVGVFIGTIFHKSLVRHVHPNIDGPLLGLEFLFGKETTLKKSTASADTYRHDRNLESLGLRDINEVNCVDFQ